MWCSTDGEQLHRRLQAQQACPAPGVLLLEAELGWPWGEGISEVEGKCFSFPQKREMVVSLGKTYKVESPRGFSLISFED